MIGTRAPLLLLVMIAISGCARRASGIPGPSAKVETLRICVVNEGRLTEVAAEVDARGDTLVGGQPFSRLFPVDERYAAEASWYVANEPFTFLGACYLKYGRPQTAAVAELRRVGAHRGVSLFAEVDDGGERPAVLYVPVRPGCHFQRYQYELLVRPCRGEGRPTP